MLCFLCVQLKINVSQFFHKFFALAPAWDIVTKKVLNWLWEVFSQTEETRLSPKECKKIHKAGVSSDELSQNLIEKYVAVIRKW